ncbi:hypothetical protein MHYP_G00262080 [Metynnis hypsauchen]
MDLLLWGVGVLSACLSSQAGLTVEAEPGLYYCSTLKGKQMIFSNKTYLQIKDRNQISSDDPEKSKEDADVFPMLVLVFGAVIAVLLSALLILIFTRPSETKDQREQHKDVGYKSDVFFMLTVVFGVVTVVQTILMIVQCIRKQRREDSNARVKEENEDQDGEAVNYAALHLNKKNKRPEKNVTVVDPNVIYSPYLYTTITPGLHFPEFISVGLVDGEPFVYYDSNIMRKIPKTEWMEKNEGEDYWNEETQTSQDHQDKFRYDVINLMKHFSQTGGGGSEDTITGDHQFTAGISVGLGLVLLLVIIGVEVSMWKRRRRPDFQPVTGNPSESE